MNIKNITPLFGAVIENISFDEMIKISKEKWKQILYDRNIIVIKDIDLSEEEFVKFSYKLGAPWGHKHYELHGERMESNGIVDWNDQSGLYKKSICWHRDNSWSKWRHPVRILYSIQIPDENSGILFYLDLRYIFNNLLSKEKQNWLNDHFVVVQNYRNKTQKFYYPLVETNPVTGQKSLFITAMDVDSNVFGLKKDKTYKKGNTFLLKVIHKSGKELSLNYLVEYIEETMKIKECFFYQKWKPNMIQIMSNLDTAHMRTEISNHPKTRLLWRKTIAHDFQIL
ncbi:MAG: TauD/TfdA family dioxygenase [Oligoflexia bacterium]|nr:TauD/TfdA family dioxygenase [Oligoflexia bacterium]